MRVARWALRALTGRSFFPELISGPFHHGLVTVFTAAAVMAVISALASLSRGRTRLPGDLTATRTPSLPSTERTPT